MRRRLRTRSATGTNSACPSRPTTTAAGSLTSNSLNPDGSDTHPDAMPVSAMTSSRYAATTGSSSTINISTSDRIVTDPHPARPGLAQHKEAPVAALPNRCFARRKSATSSKQVLHRRSRVQQKLASGSCAWRFCSAPVPERMPTLDEQQVSLIGLPGTSPDWGISGQSCRALSRSSIDRRSR